MKGRSRRIFALFCIRHSVFLPIRFFGFLIFSLQSSADTGYPDKITNIHIEKATHTQVDVDLEQPRYSDGLDGIVTAERYRGQCQ